MFTVLDDFRDQFGIQASWLGVIVGVGFLSSFLAQIFIAPLADGGHARTLVAVGMVLNILGLIGMAFGTSLPALLSARFVMGIGVGMATPAVRRIVVSGDPANLGHNLGLLLAADVAGFAAGPAISAILVPLFGLAAPFLTIAGLVALCLPVIFLVKVVEAAKGPDERFAFDLMRSRPMLAAVCLGGATFLMIGTFDALWAVVLDDLAAADWIANVGITIFALPLVVLGSFGGRLAQRIGPFRLGPLGLMLASGFMFLYGVMPTGITMLIVGTVHAISDGCTVSSSGVAVGMISPPDRQASAQGMLGASETLIAGVTAVLAGVLYESGGRVLAYSVCSLLMAALVISAWLLAGPEYRAMKGSSSEKAFGAH